MRKLTNYIKWSENAKVKLWETIYNLTPIYDISSLETAYIILIYL